MERDQVELLTREKNRIQIIHSGDVRHILDALPVKHPNRAVETVKESISQEPENTPTPGESPWVEAFLTGLSWATYAIAIVAVLFLTWFVGGGIGR